MNKYLIIYDSGLQEVIEAEDFYDIHNKTDDDRIAVVVRIDYAKFVESGIFKQG